MRKKAFQQVGSRQIGETCSPPYIEPLRAASIPFGDFVNSLLDDSTWKKEAEVFYAESVSHHFTQNEKATTTVGLTRGLSRADYDRYATFLMGSNLKSAAGDQVRSQWIALTTPDVPS